MNRRRFLGIGLMDLVAISNGPEGGASGAQIRKRATREELVRMRTEDAFELTGLLVIPAGSRRSSTAVIWIHGATANFYYPSYVDIARDGLAWVSLLLGQLVKQWTLESRIEV